MKSIYITLCVALLTLSCSKDEPQSPENGLIEFECINLVAEALDDGSGAVFTNPALEGDTTATYFRIMNWTIGDVWVSQDDVVAGASDDLDWHRLTAETNTESKLFEDYTFPAKEIPIGDYKSVKITFKNIFYRHVQLISDSSVRYELLETMGSWTDPCDPTDTSWAATNYFGTDGNHQLNSNGNFELVAPGEKIGGFSVKAYKKISLS